MAKSMLLPLKNINRYILHVHLLYRQTSQNKMKCYIVMLYLEQSTKTRRQYIQVCILFFALPFALHPQ